MIYELILSDRCNRCCKYCQIPKFDYLETNKNIRKFYDYIKKHEKNFYIISLFGGEPTLNSKGLKYVIKLFNNENCNIDLFTNGDNLNEYYNSDIFNNVNIQITTLDIFENIDKYVDILNNIKCKNIRFTYTFTEEDVHKIYQFIDICESLNVEYRFALSHTAASWKNIDDEKLYELVYEVYSNELSKSIYNKRLSNTIEKKFKRMIELRHNPNTTSRVCLGSEKMVFYRGNFIGSCILFCNKEIPNLIDDKKCNLCKYRQICDKSCAFERQDGEIPNKLCIIEKAEFDALNKYFKVC